MDVSDFREAHRRLRNAVPSTPKRVSHWTEETIFDIIRQLGETIGQLLNNIKKSDTTYWREEWTVAVNWCHCEIVYLNSGLVDAVRKNLSEQLTVAQEKHTFLFHRHEHFGDKFKNWNLTTKRPVLILGDSNLCGLPKCYDEVLQKFSVLTPKHPL